MAHIMIIDDEPMICEMLDSLFSGSGYTVTTAPDGELGLALYKDNPADVVITDIIMPESDGLETIKAMRAHNAGVKIIAISGGSRIKGIDFLEVASNLGADHVFCKPLDNDDLLNTVETCLQS